MHGINIACKLVSYRIFKVSDDNSQRFAARICEFFAIDQSEDFQIWNLQKSTTKPAHVIHFREKHQSNPDHKLYRISNTCPD